MPTQTPTLRTRSRKGHAVEIIAYALSLFHLLGTQILPLLYIVLFESCRWAWNQINRVEDNIAACEDDLIESNWGYSEADRLGYLSAARRIPAMVVTKSTSSPSIVSDRPRAHSSPSPDELESRRVATYSASEQQRRPNIQLQSTTHSLSSPSPSSSSSPSLSSPSPSASSPPDKSNSDENMKNPNRRLLPPSFSKIQRFVATHKSTDNSLRLNKEPTKRLPRIDSLMDAFRKHFPLEKSYSYTQ